MTVDKAAKRTYVERVIAAPPEKIFDVLADPAQHPVIDGSGSVKASRDNPERLSLGAKFGMDMRLGFPYRITNEVVEFEEGKRIAWWHKAHNAWRYELEPVEGGTLVRETFDWSQSRAPFLLFNFPERNETGMEQTLERLERYVTTGSAD